MSSTSIIADGPLCGFSSHNPETSFTLFPQSGGEVGRQSVSQSLQWSPKWIREPLQVSRFEIPTACGPRGQSQPCEGGRMSKIQGLEPEKELFHMPSGRHYSEVTDESKRQCVLNIFKFPVLIQRKCLVQGALV